jgi:hypothetical protein
VYAAPFDNEETLHRRTADAFQTIRTYPGISERMRRSVMRSVEAMRKSADKSLAFLISYFLVCSTTKRILLGWVKEVRTTKS